MGKIIVSISRAVDYDESRVFDKIAQSLEPLGGIKAFVKQGNKVLIKPNLLQDALPDKAITTHPSVVKAVINLVKEAGGIPLIGDSPAIVSLEKAAEKSGIKKVAKETNTKLLEFKNELAIKPSDDRIFKKIEIVKDVTDVDFIINLPKLKTHTQMLLTLAVKNLFGCVYGKKKGQWHIRAGYDRNHFAALLVELYQIIKPGLTIMDAIVGMEGEGPANGKPRNLGLIFAGTDCVAIDRVITEVLGIDGSKNFTTEVAGQKGVGVANIKDIDISGERVRDVRISNFKLPPVMEIEWGRKYLAPVKRIMKNSLTSRPVEVQDICTLCASCIEVCPADIITIKKGRLKFDYRRCISCFCCQEVCPEGAIRIKQGWLLKYMKR